MKVLHFAHSFIPQYGGTTTRLINLLSDRRHVHTICVPMPRVADGETPPNVEQFDNITVRRVRLGGGPSIGPFAARNARRLAAAVGADDAFDIVQGHNPPPFARAAYRVAEARGLPCIYEAHRLSFDSFGANRESALPSSIDRAIRAAIRREERPFFERADAVIVQTVMHRDRICELFRVDGGRIHVIPMGVDETRFDPATAGDVATQIRARHSWGDRVIFFYNGFLGASNGLRTMLDAAQALPPEIRRRVRIAILGRGPLSGLVERASRANPELIQSLGSVRYEAMPGYYAAADVVVIPVAPIRLWQCNNPTKLLEAMAMERPVLASDVRGVTELLEDGVTGFAFRAGDTGALTRKMVDLAAGQIELEGIGRAARTRVLRDRTWAAVRTLLDRAYQRIC